MHHTELITTWRTIVACIRKGVTCIRCCAQSICIAASQQTVDSATARALQLAMHCIMQLQTCTCANAIGFASILVTMRSFVSCQQRRTHQGHSHVVMKQKRCTAVMSWCKKQLSGQGMSGVFATKRNLRDLLCAISHTKLQSAKSDRVYIHVTTSICQLTQYQLIECLNADLQLLNFAVEPRSTGAAYRTSRQSL